MAETLGEALLVLRTDDGHFARGVSQAEAKAERLGQSLDKTSASSGRLARELHETGQSAAASGARMAEAGQKVASSAGAQRQGFQQLSMQLGDVAAMYALGARPMQIFASQSGQVIQSIQLMSGGSSRLAAFLGGPWGIALTTAALVVTPFVGKLFEAEDALANVRFASDRLGDAQGILGSVIDRTTGKIKTQSSALLALARAQAVAGMVEARRRQAEARSELGSISRGGLGDVEVQFSIMGAPRVVQRERGKQVVDLFRAGRISAAEAEEQLRLRLRNGMISDAEYFRAAGAIGSFGLEGENIKIFEDTLAALDGDSAAARRILGPQGGGGARSGTPAAARGPSEPERAREFFDRSLDLERQSLQARLQLTTSAAERAALQMQLLDLERKERIAAVEASDLDAKRKAALIAQIELLLGPRQQEVLDENGELTVRYNDSLEAQLIRRERAANEEQEAAALAETRFNVARDALDLELQLADSQSERKAIALKLLEAEDAMLRARHKAVLASEVASEAEKERARIALEALDATAPARRAAVGRQNETEIERYVRLLNPTQDQLREALDGIALDGLEALNDGLTQAIMGVQSLGDVFSRVADQIIADLLRIAIQQAIIKPLFGALFGAAPSGALVGSVNSLIDGEFAGLFARGGTIPPGGWGIVGEEGPELAFAGPGGLGIFSHSDSRKMLSSSTGGGTTVSIPISIDATGADPAAIERLRAQLAQLQADLPARIVTTVQQAQDRRILNLGGGR